MLGSTLALKIFMHILGVLYSILSHTLRMRTVISHDHVRIIQSKLYFIQYNNNLIYSIDIFCSTL